MNLSFQSENTVVDRVQISPLFGDAGEQQRIGQLLGRTSLRPTSLPACAILIVRSLRSVLPPRAPLRHEIYLPSEWEQSATAELNRMVAQAARPAMGPVPLLAQSVLFLNRTEWLTCLAQDWLRGTLRANWWWSSLLKHGDPESVLLRQWHESPEFLPSSLNAMAAGGASEFLQRITEDQASTLLQQMLRAFAVPTARAARAQAESESRKSSQTEYSKSDELGPHLIALPNQKSSPGFVSMRDQSTQMAQTDARIDDGLPTEPWLSWAREASVANLSVVKRVFLAQALMLHRAPAKARSISFQKQVASWREWAESPGMLSNAQTEPPGIAEHRASKPASSEAARTSQLRQGVPQNVEPAVESATPFSTPALDEQKPPALPEYKSKSTAKVADAPATPSPSTLESAFAGVCFLLNVALYLKLYADFTAPRTEGLDLDIWDFVCLLGQKFTEDELAKDPFFDALAALSGRSKLEQPGASFEPADRWALPSEWLDAFPEAVASRETVKDGRRQLAHPAGFLLSDRPAEDATETVDALARWVGWIGSYVRARLVRALGREDAAQLLCRVPGRLAYTPTRVDVFFSLDSYPTEIRLAGLDRDPGWIPAAGRYVAYHFQ